MPKGAGRQQPLPISFGDSPRSLAPWISLGLFSLLIHSRPILALNQGYNSVFIAQLSLTGMVKLSSRL